MIRSMRRASLGQVRKSPASLALALGIFVLATVPSCRPKTPLTLEEDAEKGTLTVRDRGVDVLTYRFLDQLDPAAPPNYVRSCYIHPLNFLDGRVLTHDFPPDHFHHHGLFWTWPVVNVRGQKTQTWHPATPSLRQHFVRWTKREASDYDAEFSVDVAWKLDEEDLVAEESTAVWIRPANGLGRAVDLEIVLKAVGGPMELRGSPESNKGYGGLCFRGAPLFTGGTMTTDLGPLTEDSTDQRFRWADISTKELGVAVFVSPDHPGFPTTWLVRNSYAGVINPSWPGLEGAILDEDGPVSLKYRVYLHRGDVTAGKVKEAYQTYLGVRD